MLTSTSTQVDKSMINPQITKSTQLVVITESGLQYEGKPLQVGQLLEIRNADAGKYILRGWARQAKINSAQYNEFLIERSAGITTVVEVEEPEPENTDPVVPEGTEPEDNTEPLPDPEPVRKPGKHGKR